MTEAWKREREMKGLGREDGEGGLERRRKKKKADGENGVGRDGVRVDESQDEYHMICKLSYSNVRGPH